MNTQPHDDDVAWPDDAVEVARVQDAWGIKGWLRVQPHAADPQALFSSRRWFLQPPAGKPRPKDAPPLPRLLHVTLVKEHGDGIVASVREVADRNGAEALKGARIFVSRQSFPSTDDGEYYWVDLIGLEVVNREGEPLGTVAEMIDTGPHCVMRLEQASTDAAGKARTVERMIPFVAAYIDGVDLPGRRITADWGLDY
ncbi:16S rRNA processing protein RimM [Sphaerotilus sulfidivorans]|jgi:16S rRNA processing protein RimM|uniref:Ribosome maturation factor RimM n=2 Tax=Pseudomonadota TaxID=1224 RepID=A0A5C1PW45_9BURK|nr:MULTISPECIES: ribosome maturation factor RimM [Sphaerotilus]GIX52621.1 ribosome maturation factor RimM [Sphaerotilus natans]MCK6400400.1 ribosome maturation factor RimM [Sphaerotilus sulfidivorans]NZD47414.1 ribosome maturation factor RimM [Sphaerotilus sulfidivorans]QEM99854.1 ribosome maturation factor RimM [Sphaerotilus sulfidivorans]GKQ59197.1 ribosome maturation factor RimM [Sphaerotilus sp. FB-3]